MEKPSARKALNKVKAKVEYVQGPVKKDPDTAPVADAIRAYWERDTLSFAIPAHAGARGGVEPLAAEWAGSDAFRTDVPMTHGVDNRHRSWQVQSTAQELFADAVDAKQTLFSTNGSSLSAHVALMTVAGPGEKIVMARNGHKSAFAGLVMSGADPVWVEPEYDEDLALAHAVTPEAVAEVLERTPDARAVLIFTPTYYGVSADISGVADVVHARDLPLVTDDAWGLDYDFHPDLPPPALKCGSDLAIGSVHKTTTALQQTSVLSVGSDRIDTERLQLCFELEESTSTSTLLLSSIDGARLQFQREGQALMERALSSARRLRKAIAQMPGFDLMTDAVVGRPGAAHFDPTHVTFDVTGIGLTGYQAADWLRDERGIEFEMSDHRRLMALVTFAHDDAAIDRLVAALRDLIQERGGRDGSQIPDIPGPTQLRTEQVMRPRDAFFSRNVESVSPDDAPGRLSAEMITPYPPGIPVLAPGERITEPIVDYLQKFTAAGGYVEGAADPSLDSFRVVAA